MAQDEPKKDDEVAVSDGFSFSVEQEIADAVDSFEIDYRNGWLNRGFAVYPNGYRSSC